MLLGFFHEPLLKHVNACMEEQTTLHMNHLSPTSCSSQQNQVKGTDHICLKYLLSSTKYNSVEVVIEVAIEEN